MSAATSPSNIKQSQRRSRNSVRSENSDAAVPKTPETQVNLNLNVAQRISKPARDKSEMEVLFEGIKNLWKLRTSIDIYFILHKYTLVPTVEVIAFHPTLDVESNRMYISVPLLESKLDNDLIQVRIDAKKECLNRQKKAFSVMEIAQEVKMNILVDFLFSRIDAPSEKLFFYRLCNLFIVFCEL